MHSSWAVCAAKSGVAIRRRGNIYFILVNRHDKTQTPDRPAEYYMSQTAKNGHKD
jgi:hypothetical protein